jgi:hypothetical protein
MDVRGCRANELKQFNQRYHYVRGPPPLPIGAFINHYRQQQVNGMTKHIDWTAGQHQKKGLPVLCSVVGLLGTCDDNDTNCLRFIDEISDTIIPTPLHIGEFITFHPSLPHSVPWSMQREFSSIPRMSDQRIMETSTTKLSITYNQFIRMVLFGLLAY